MVSDLLTSYINISVKTPPLWGKLIYFATKFTLEKAMKAQSRSRGKTLLFL
jgi:hypothetical protein